MSNYIYTNGELYSEDYLQHYGVLGMKWGTRRAIYKTNRNDKLLKKSLKYDLKSSKNAKKSEKLHNTLDLAGANKKAVKAAKWEVKSDRLAKKANKQTDESKRLNLQRKSAKYSYKAKKLKVDTNSISKSKGYGAKAMKYSVKSDIFAKKAEKMRYKIAKNKAYVNKMNRKISSLSKEELAGAYSFVNELKKVS